VWLAGATDAGGVHGTSFHEVLIDGDDEDDLELLMRLQALFAQHTPAAARREEAARPYTPSEPFALPGARWRGASPFASFLQAGGLLARGGSGSARGGLQRHDVELIVLSVCGKGGWMDVLDFAEACAKVAHRLAPEGTDTPTAELLSALLEQHYA
jgi:hypothetical protein